MSFQNRCVIPTANGATTLSVPLQGGRENNQTLAEVRIDNSQRWQVRHWRTITAAYNRSPYFEFYADGLQQLFDTRFEHLHQWNTACLQWLLKQYGLQVTVEELMSPGSGQIAGNVLPKHFQDPALVAALPRYGQVFMERTGFMPNMSSIDLLFCAGKNSLQLFG